MNSPLTDPPVSSRLQGRAAPSTKRQPDGLNSPGQGGPGGNSTVVAMNKGGKGTSGRKTFPNLGM